MTTVLLIRHGLTDVTGSLLIGRLPGYHLSDKGNQQAEALAARLQAVPLAAIVTSPLERCVETAQHVAAGRDGVPIEKDDRVGEVGYGDWSGKELRKLVKEPLWRQVQVHPSAVRFPGDDGERFAELQTRAVEAVRDWNARLGADATYAVVSHADVIKSIVADAVGLHFDQFQRIVVDPASVTVIRYTELRPFLYRLNDVGGSVDDLKPPKRKPRTRKKPDSDAVVGGGAGGRT